MPMITPAPLVRGAEVAFDSPYPGECGDALRAGLSARER
jgi:hypothetical protein